MTANRMMDVSHGDIGFEEQVSPVTNTLRVGRLPDGNVEVSFCSTWAQAGASHSTDGALVLSRVDAEALAAVLAPGMMLPADMPTLRPAGANRRWVFEDKPPTNTRLDEIMLQVARVTAESNDAPVRAALIAAGWLPPERLEAIAASWDGVKTALFETPIGEKLREEFKNA
jgi:hypothetical protein